jgi:4-carboxymuconolactone decarboxylase
VPRLPSVTQPAPAQKPAYDYLLQSRGPSGLKGGFGVMLASPEICQRIAHVGSYIRFDSPIPRRMREVAATAISSELENPWEYVIHAKICREELGVPADVVRAILDCKPLPPAGSGATDDDMLAINVSREMARGHKLSQATFDAAKQRLGAAGVVDLLATVGYFAMLAVTHKALEVYPEGT